MHQYFFSGLLGLFWWPLGDVLVTFLVPLLPFGCHFGGIWDPFVTISGPSGDIWDPFVTISGPFCDDYAVLVTFGALLWWFLVFFVTFRQFWWHLGFFCDRVDVFSRRHFAMPLPSWTVLVFYAVSLLNASNTASTILHHRPMRAIWLQPFYITTRWTTRIGGASNVGVGGG